MYACEPTKEADEMFPLTIIHLFTDKQIGWVRGRWKEVMIAASALVGREVQGWAKEWSKGCVNPASGLPLATGREFTQPRDHLLADPCIYLLLYMQSIIPVRRLG